MTKFHHCRCKYKIEISVWKSKVIWINGPICGRMHDKEIFAQGLLAHIPKGKLVIVDRGYKFENKDQDAKLSWPRATDSKLLNHFKSRAQACHESFNRRMKKIACLSGKYFRHRDGAASGRKFYGNVIEAVITILQYKLDNGKKLFAV